MNNKPEVSEVMWNLDKFTLVIMDTCKGPYQVSLRGHNLPLNKIERAAKSIENAVKGLA